jgi:hypothetical protein
MSVQDIRSNDGAQQASQPAASDQSLFVDFSGHQQTVFLLEKKPSVAQKIDFK